MNTENISKMTNLELLDILSDFKGLCFVSSQENTGLAKILADNYLEKHKRFLMIPKDIK